MDFCSLASGSSGNCSYIGSESTAVLLDIGLSMKRMEERLHLIGRTGEDLDAVLITHEHSDHIQGLGVLARRRQIPIYLTRGTKEALQANRSLGEIPEDLFRIIEEEQPFQIGDLTVVPFATSHDAAQPVGYRVNCGSRSIAAATDLGTYTERTIRHLQQVNVLLLEANHDVHMLEAGRYPYYLKMRILGEKGHLSNEASGQLLNEVLHDHMKHIILGHLSEENNYPALAYETVAAEVTMADSPYRAGDFPISVAPRREAGELIHI